MTQSPTLSQLIEAKARELFPVDKKWFPGNEKSRYKAIQLAEYALSCPEVLAAAGLGAIEALEETRGALSGMIRRMSQLKNKVGIDELADKQLNEAMQILAKYYDPNQPQWVRSDVKSEQKGMRWVKASEPPKELNKSYYCRCWSKQIQEEFKKTVLIALNGLWLTEYEVTHWLDESPQTAGLSKAEWIDVEVQAPLLNQKVNFIVESKDPNYNGEVFGGKYFGKNYGYHEFAVPGVSFKGTKWLPIPQPPQQ